MSAHLLATGNELVGLNEADVIIINTCTVTGDAEKKTRKAVRRALRENTYARVMVTGCAAAISPDFYRALDSRVEIIEKADFLSADPACRTGLAFPARVSVKVQDGCDHACTYCIVHVARGKAFSRPLDEIVAEVKALERAGIREVMLSGIDLGSYRFEKQALDALLSTLIEATHEMRFRISSVEPASLTPLPHRGVNKLKGVSAVTCICLCSRAQRRCSRRQNRPYGGGIHLRLARTPHALPTLALSTDIICGFPGETDAEFEETLLLAKQARFSKIHAFRYSMREGTPAAARCDQIDPSTKEQRLKKLLALARDLRKEDGLRRIGTSEAVLIEAPGTGMSESYFKVEVPRDIPQGTLCELSLTAP